MELNENIQTEIESYLPNNKFILELKQYVENIILI
jgi:hypothetical protein